MTRRTFLKLCAASAAALTACATTSLEEEAEPEAAPEAGTVIDTGTVTPEAEDSEAKTVGLAYMPSGGVHPYNSTNVTNLPIQSLLYESLFIINRNFEPEGVLCRSYHTTADLKAWYFELEPNVTFSDGTLLTADDVVASFEAAEDCGLYGARFRFVYHFIADDEHTVRVTCGIPCSNLPAILDLPIVKASSLEEEIPVGTGPYYLSGERLYRNTYWWQQETAEPGISADLVKLIGMEDLQDIRDEFQFGDVDVVYTDPYNSSLPAFQGDNEPWGINTAEMQYLAFNLYGTYCANASVRSAFTYIVDRASIIADIYGGEGLAATLPCNPAASIYDSALASEYAYNIDTFRQKFSDSNFKPDPGNPMKFLICNSNTRRVDAAQMIVDALNSCGFYTKLYTYKRSEFRYLIRSNEFDVLMSEVRLPPNFDLAAFFGHNTYCSVGGIVSDTNKSYMNAAIENSGNYYELWRSLMNRGILCPIMFKVNTLYTTRGTLKDTEPSLSNLLQGNGLKTMEELAAAYGAD